MLLLERNRELAAIDATLDRAASRAGSLLLITAAPGLGKSALLAEARRRARDRGFVTLRAQGSEQEQWLPFGGAMQLFERVVRDSSAGDLAGAAANARELFTPSPQQVNGLPADRVLRIVHGLFWLTANLAEPPGAHDSTTIAPLALLLDDVHMLDPQTLRFLLYLAHRLEDLPVAVFAATRPPDAAAGVELTALVAEPSELIRPAPLTGPAVATLLAHELGESAVGARLTEAAVEASGGNPFLLRALAQELQTGQATAEQVGALAPQSVLRAIRARLARLSPEAVRLAEAVVLLDPDADPGLAAELAEIEPMASVAARDALAREGILEPEGPLLRFVHPLVRQTVAADLPAGWRKLTELRAARLMSVRGAGVEKVAEHLMRAAAGGDPWVYTTLTHAAERARRRGASHAAAGYLHRALREPPPAAQRAQLLTDLAQAEAEAGQPQAALERLDEALALLDSAPAQARLLCTIGRQLATAGRHPEAATVFERALPLAREPELRRELTAALAITGASGAGSAPVLAALVDELQRTHADGPLVVREVLGLAAAHGAISGRAAAEFGALALRACEGETLAATVARDGGLAITPAAVALLYADELPAALRLLDNALRRAQLDGSVLAAATVSYLRAWPLYFSGALSEAISAAEEALAATRYGWGLHADAARAVLAHTRIERGELAAARALLADTTPVLDWAESSLLLARARLRLADLDPTGALADLEACRTHLATQGVMTRPLPWRGLMAVTLLMVGKREQARALAAEQYDLYLANGAPRLVGMALRALGLVEGGSHGVKRLNEAVAVLAGSPSRLEYARALVDLGAVLRRDGRRADARAPLRQGLALAEEFGAVPLSEQAREELKAAGGRPRTARAGGLDALTPSERRVAAMAADGLTNREIAQRLFVTTKAVEFHMRHVFDKLDVRSRTELPALFAAGAPLDGVAGSPEQPD